MRTWWLLVVLASCGSPDTGAVTEARADEDCRISCAFEQACTGADLDTCAARCVANVAGWARTDALDAYSACHGALACDASDDTCLVQIAPLPIHRTWETTCRAQLASCMVNLDVECSAAFDPNVPDSGFIRFVAPVIVQMLIDCLHEADCAARTSCISGVTTTYGLQL